MAKGLLSKPPKNQKKKNANRANKRGLTPNQQQLANQTVDRDLSIGQGLGALTPGLIEQYSQPMDYSGIPEAPVTGDFNDWRQEQIDSTYNDFSRRMDPQFDKQRQEFDSSMVRRGIPIGSELYNNQKQLLEQGINDAKSSAMVSAQGIAGQNAGQFFDVGTVAHGNAYNERVDQRNRPLTEYGALQGLQSGVGPAAIKQSWDVQNQNRQFNQQKSLGSGGGGGGPTYAWQTYGFGSPQEYDAYQDQRDLANKQAQLQLAQQYGPKQPSQPNPYASLGGSVLGSAASGIFENLGKTGKAFGYKLWS